MKNDGKGGSALRRRKALLLCLMILPLLLAGPVLGAIDPLAAAAPPPDGLARAERTAQLMIMPVESPSRQLSWQRGVTGFGAVLRMGLLAMLGLLGCALMRPGDDQMPMMRRLTATYHSIHAPPRMGQAKTGAI